MENMTLEDVKRKGTISELVGRLSKAESDLRQLLVKSGAMAGARLYGNANQSIPNNNVTTLSFSTVTFDQGAFWNIANPDRLTISIPGVYWIGGAVEFAANANGVRAIGIRLGGATIIAWSLIDNPGAAPQPSMGISTLYPLVAGNYLEIIVYQNSGAPLNSLTVGVYTPVGMIQRVS